MPFDLGDSQFAFGDYRWRKHDAAIWNNRISPVFLAALCRRRRTKIRLGTKAKFDRRFPPRSERRRVESTTPRGSSYRIRDITQQTGSNFKQRLSTRPRLRGIKKPIGSRNGIDILLWIRYTSLISLRSPPSEYFPGISAILIREGCTPLPFVSPTVRNPGIHLPALKLEL